MRRFENINGEKPRYRTHEHAKGSKHIIPHLKTGMVPIIPEYANTVKNKNPMDAVKNRKVIPGLYEVAVFFNGELCYDTPTTNDVLRSKNDPEVQDIVQKIPKTRAYDNTSFA